MSLFSGASGRSLEGHTFESEGRWSSPFVFVQLADPQLGLYPSVKEAQSLLEDKDAETQKSEQQQKQQQQQQQQQRQQSLSEVQESQSQPKTKVAVPLDLRPDLSISEAYARELQFSSRAVSLINALSPAFAVVCGDLVNAYPSQRELQDKQVEDFKEIFGRINEDIPLICICGNHDIGDRPSRENIELFKSRFGDDYFSFWTKGVKFIVINSQLYKDCTDCPELMKEQDEWLEAEMAQGQADKAQHIIVLSHIPPFIHSPDEPSGYFNLEKGIRQNLLEKMAHYGVKAWFCGHYHRNAGGLYRYKQSQGKDSQDSTVETDENKQTGEERKSKRAKICSTDQEKHIKGEDATGAESHVIEIQHSNGTEGSKLGGTDSQNPDASDIALSKISAEVPGQVQGQYKPPTPKLANGDSTGHSAEQSETQNQILEVVITTAIGCTITTDPDESPLELAGMDGATVEEDCSGLRLVTVGEREISHSFFTVAEVVKMTEENQKGREVNVEK